jgi:hypothetical protein
VIQARFRVLAICLGALGSAAPAFAQLDRGSISGTIKDQSGAIMPGVTVTAPARQTKPARP